MPSDSDARKGDCSENDQESADQWHVVAPLTSIPEGAGREFLVDGRILAVFCVDGQFYALDGICAHQGGPLADGQIGRTDQGRCCVTCPWHGWQYELANGNHTISGKALAETFAVRQRDGNLEVNLRSAK